MKKKTCKNCIFWERYLGLAWNSKYGKCYNYKFKDKLTEVDAITDDELHYMDANEYYAVFEVGQNFGCIHFEKKEE